VEVVFASSASSADEVIRHRLRRANDPAGLLVVSSDWDVQEAARARGARAIDAEAFAMDLAGLEDDEEEELKPATAGSTEEWMRLFGA
jgi:predicted RNA-binding protein with PIN domain